MCQYPPLCYFKSIVYVYDIHLNLLSLKITLNSPAKYVAFTIHYILTCYTLLKETCKKYIFFSSTPSSLPFYYNYFFYYYYYFTNRKV